MSLQSPAPQDANSPPAPPAPAHLLKVAAHAASTPMSHSQKLGDATRRSNTPGHAADQGLTLVHFIAQRKRFLWDRGRL